MALKGVLSVTSLDKRVETRGEKKVNRKGKADTVVKRGAKNQNGTTRPYTGEALGGLQGRKNRSFRKF